jgi:hypothetical protein
MDQVFFSRNEVVSSNSSIEVLLEAGVRGPEKLMHLKKCHLTSHSDLSKDASVPKNRRQFGI